MTSCIVFLYIISCLGRGRLRLHMVFIVKLHRKIAWWKWIIVSVGYSVLGVLNLLPDFIMKSAVKRFQFVSQGFIGEGRLFSCADVPCCIYSDSAFGAQSGCYLVVAYAPWQFKAEYKIQFTSIPTWFSIGRLVADWWKLHATHVNDFPAFNPVAHALLLIATTSSSTTTTAMLVINCSKDDLWRWKAKLQLSVFFQAERARVRTRQPEIKLSKRKGGGDCSAWIKSHYVRQNGTFKPCGALFPKIAKVCSLRACWVGKNPDLSLRGLLFLLPSSSHR